MKFDYSNTAVLFHVTDTFLSAPSIFSSLCSVCLPLTVSLNIRTFQFLPLPR